MEGNPTFREVQRFRQWWLWALLGAITLPMLVLGPVSWVGLLVVGPVIGLLSVARLRTEVRADGVYVELWPLHRSFRRFTWDEIEEYEARRYSPLREFGGWGIRWAPGTLAYNVSGDRGVWIERTDGRALLVGSRRPQEFVEAMDEAIEQEREHP